MAGANLTRINQLNNQIAEKFEDMKKNIDAIQVDYITAIKERWNTPTAHTVMNQVSTDTNEVVTDLNKNIPSIVNDIAQLLNIIAGGQGTISGESLSLGSINPTAVEWEAHESEGVIYSGKIDGFTNEALTPQVNNLKSNFEEVEQLIGQVDQELSQVDYDTAAVSEAIHEFKNMCSTYMADIEDIAQKYQDVTISKAQEEDNIYQQNAQQMQAN